MIIQFDFEKFKKQYGKLCPCILPSGTTVEIDWICPCREFRESGKCRCGLFKIIVANGKK